MTYRRGSTILASLLILSILLILGMAFLGKRSTQYEEQKMAGASNLAKQIALAGLEDARVKLLCDVDFPPPADLDQKTFTYSEPLFDLDGTTLRGSYEVTIDREFEEAPYFIWRITSIGIVGESEPAPGAMPRARRRLEWEFDISPLVRGGSTPNPYLFEPIRFIDHGILR